MNTYLIVAQIKRTITNKRNNNQSSVEFLSNRCIEANTKKEAFEQYNKIISEEIVIDKNFTVYVQDTVLNMIEL